MRLIRGARFPDRRLEAAVHPYYPLFVRRSASVASSPYIKECGPGLRQITRVYPPFALCELTLLGSPQMGG
jgi:hypothetical protein